jgi:hypothetical protein
VLSNDRRGFPDGKSRLASEGLHVLTIGLKTSYTGFLTCWVHACSGCVFDPCRRDRGRKPTTSIDQDMHACPGSLSHGLPRPLTKTYMLTPARVTILMNAVPKPAASAHLRCIDRSITLVLFGSTHAAKFNCCSNSYHPSLSNCTARLLY